jgi:hypothetical protein
MFMTKKERQMLSVNERYSRDIRIINMLIYGMIILLMLLSARFAFAAEKVEVVTFEWDQTEVEFVTGWEMHWSDTAGGAYVKLVDIPVPEPDPENPNPTTFMSPVTGTVTGTPGTTVTKHFVLRACGTPPEEEFGCSDWSNEVAYGFDIPIHTFQVPVQFRVAPTP